MPEPRPRHIPGYTQYTCTALACEFRIAGTTLARDLAQQHSEKTGHLLHIEPNPTDDPTDPSPVAITAAEAEQPPPPPSAGVRLAGLLRRLLVAMDDAGTGCHSMTVYPEQPEGQISIAFRLWHGASMATAEDVHDLVRELGGRCVAHRPEGQPRDLALMHHAVIDDLLVEMVSGPPATQPEGATR